MPRKRFVLNALLGISLLQPQLHAQETSPSPVHNSAAATPTKAAAEPTGRQVLKHLVQIARKNAERARPTNPQSAEIWTTHQRYFQTLLDRIPETPSARAVLRSLKDYHQKKAEILRKQDDSHSQLVMALAELFQGLLDEHERVSSEGAAWNSVQFRFPPASYFPAVTAGGNSNEGPIETPPAPPTDGRVPPVAAAAVPAPQRPGTEATAPIGSEVSSGQPSNADLLKNVAVVHQETLYASGDPSMARIGRTGIRPDRMAFVLILENRNTIPVDIRELEISSETGSQRGVRPHLLGLVIPAGARVCSKVDIRLTGRDWDESTTLKVGVSRVTSQVAKADAERVAHKLAVLRALHISTEAHESWGSTPAFTIENELNREVKGLRILALGYNARGRLVTIHGCGIEKLPPQSITPIRNILGSRNVFTTDYDIAPSAARDTLDEGNVEHWKTLAVDIDLVRPY